MKRLITLLLAVAMVLSLVPAAAAANDPGWALDGNWTYDTETGVLRQTTAGGGFNTWKQDISGGVELSYVVNFSEVEGELSRACGYLREWDNGAWQFLNYEIQRNAEHSQVYAMIRFSSDSGVNWTNGLQTTDWTVTSLSSLKVTFRMAENSDTLQWIFSDPTTGEVLQSQNIAISNFSDAFNSGVKQFLLYAESNSGLISYQDVQLKAAVEEEDTTGRTPVTFPCNADWNTADFQPDNTKDYEIGYDLDLTQIVSCTEANTWADNYAMVIRDPVNDAYFKHEIQSFCNGSGKYQAAISAQYWDGQNWSDRPFNWSTESNAPISKLHVVLTYDADNNTYSWVVTDRESNAVIDRNSLTATMPEVLRACTACELKTFVADKNNTVLANAPTNAYIKTEKGGEEPAEEYDPTKTPADFGWQTDAGKSFVNWQVSTDGTHMKITNDGKSGHRIYKELVQDSENFCVKMNVQIVNGRCEVEVMGKHIELNAQGGNGNQIYNKEINGWFDAKSQTCELTIARMGGGDLTVKMLGKGNAKAEVFALTPTNTADRNVYIGAIDTGNEVVYANVRDEGISGQNPGDFGWETDEGQDFSGWATVDGLNITGIYAQTTGSHRIWKSLISDQNSFSVKLAAALRDDTSAYVKVLNQTLELDTRGRNGQQVYVKVNGEGEWLDVENLVVPVYLSCDGGDLEISVVGTNEVKTYNIANKENSNNVELGLYAGTAEFRSIRAGKAAMGRRAVPFGTVAFDGVFAGADSLCADISEYQNHTVKPVAGSEADLVVVTPAAADFTAAASAEVFLSAFAARLNAVKGDVVVVASLPYIADADADKYAAANAGLRALAEQKGYLYADLYAAMGERAWSLNSAVGQTVAAGEVLEQLLRSCTCLAVNSVSPIKTTCTPAPAKTAEALAAFNAAATAEAVSAALENEALGLNLRSYRALSSENQAKVCAALAAAEKNAADFTAADALVLAETIKVSRANPRKDMTREIKTYVSVGDSITEGAQAVDRTTDCYAARFAAMLNALSPVTFINKGISGTRMCTRTDNDMFPPAKETVDDYIVANHPDLLTIAYGINDFHAGTSKQEFLTTYHGYLAEIQEKLPDTVVMVFSITAKGNDADAAGIKEWNAGIKALAEEFGYIYVDTYYDMRGVEWLLDDGLHPTNAGYRVLANVAMRTFNEYICINSVPVETHTPDEFGWDTDEPKDFSGWTATDAANVVAVYDKTTGNHRIWKGLLTNQKDFTAELDISTNNKSSAYVKVLGVTLELDSRGGDGNQSFVKLNGRNHDWVKGEACEMHVKLERKDGGDLTVIVTGKNGDKMELSAAPTEENENLELGLYAGTAKYENITVTCKEVEQTTFLVTFVDGLTGETIAVRTVETGESATAPAAPEHEGYTFKGWDKAFDNVTENLTVTALYEKNKVEYTVTFVDGLTKETIAAVKVEEGKSATAPEAPKHEGYTFKGWDKAFDNVTENLTVTALYEKNKTEYTVTFVDGLTKETIAAVKAEEGKSATAPEAPKHEGYTFKGWDKAFANVTENLTVTAIYEKNAEPAKPWVNPFKDVKTSDWFYEGVKFANQQELFNGTAHDTFSPNDAMTRAMLVTVLWRLDGKTTPTKTSGFVDVPSKAYYTEAVAWAAENGIVNGTDATHFAPNDEVTREQIAAILFRYAEKKGVDTTKRADLNAFPDANKVSAYAKDALAWANAEGLVKGSNENGKDYLIPTGSATRAQVATILARYAQNIVK